MTHNYDTYMALIREAEETPERERTREQRRLLVSLENSPSWNDLFKKTKKTATNPTNLLKGILPQVDGIQVIENASLPARTIMISKDVAEMLKQLPADKKGEPE